MRRSLLTVGVGVALLAAWSIGRVQAQGNNVVFVSAGHATYAPMEGSRNGVSTAALWGDQNVGAHGTFSKFVPGHDAGEHIHTNDTWIVVIRAPISTKTNQAKSVSAQATSSASPAATNIGAAATKPKAPCSTKSRRANST